ncbi:MAG TPA: tetratricopeptide repeat protein [Rectinemataceae bacterium]|nr:tetratricopeptide repeat protein [Rectinemataceae bacterium]
MKTAAPGVLAKAKAERDALEAVIAFGSPSSLMRARSMLGAVSSLRPEDRRDLAAIIDGIETLVYPDPRRPGKAPASIPPSQASAPATNPAPAPGPDASAAAGSTAPATSAPATSAPQPSSSLFSQDLRLLASAAVGQSVTPPPEIVGTALGELIPALALWVSSSRETARQAQDAFDRFAQLHVDSILPDLAMGIDAERRLDWSAALDRYRRVLYAAPDVWPAIIGTGRSLLALGRPVSALAVLQPKATELDGVPAFTRSYGQALYENARFAEAEGPVTRALTDDPQDYRLVLMRAHLLVRDKSFQQAVPLLDAYGTVDASNRLFLLLRSLAAEGLRIRDEALRWARRGLTLYPDDPELLVTAARLLYAGPASGYAEAHSLAAHAYEVTTAPADPSTPVPGSEQSPAAVEARSAAAFEAARLLTIDAADRYQWGAAETYLERALSLGSFDDRSLAAEVMRKSGNWTESLAYADSWHRERPESEAATEAYIRALVGTGNSKTAQDLIARLLPASGTPSFRSILYYLQSTMQKSDDAALALLRSALIEDSDNPEALAAMYDILFRRKDWNRARFYLRQALTLDPGNPELQRRQRELDAASPP